MAQIDTHLQVHPLTPEQRQKHRAIRRRGSRRRNWVRDGMNLNDARQRERHHLN